LKEGGRGFGEAEVSGVGQLYERGRRDRRGERAPGDGWADPVVLTDDDQSRYVDGRQPGREVVARCQVLEEVCGDLGVETAQRHQLSRNVFMAGCGVERKHQAVEVFPGLFGEVTREQPSRGRAGGRAASLEGSGRWGGIFHRPERRGGVAENQSACQRGMTDRKLERDEPASRVAENHRSSDAQCGAQAGDIVGHLLERARLSRLWS
jgi:hypothetical protein